MGSVGRIPSPAQGRAPLESQDIPEYCELEGPCQVRPPRAVVTKSLLSGWRTGRKAPPSKAGMEEALPGWILVGLGFESSSGISGDVFALGRGCSWSPPGAESGKVSCHLEISQESSLAPFSQPFPARCLVFSHSCCFSGTLLPGSSHPLIVLGTEQTLAVTQSMRNPSRNPAAKAVISGGCGSGCHCTLT